MKKPIYPEINIDEIGTRFELLTNLRLKYEGEWRLLRVMMNYDYERGERAYAKDHSMQQFCAYVYSHLICAVPANAPVDPDQTDEHERVLNLFK